MILLHRLTPFAALAVLVTSFGLLIYSPLHPLAVMATACAIIIFLLARLLRWEWQRFAFWVFFGMPIFFLVSSFSFFLLLEALSAMWFLSIAVVFGFWLYTENLFMFYHLPRSYQPYALEHLSLVLGIASVFFFTSSAYGTQLFLGLPLWVPSIAIFWIVLLLTLGIFWVSKIEKDVSLFYALSGAFLMTQMYLVLAFLPTSFVVNAVAFATLLYVYMGLSRVHVLDRLSGSVLRRYLGIGSFFLLLIFATAKWV